MTNGIKVEVKTSKQEGFSKVTYSGSIVDIISDQEVKTFNLTDSNLKNAVLKSFGSQPDDVYLKSPTPWNDLYYTYNWQQVLRTLAPTNATVLDIQTKPEVLRRAEFVNNSSGDAKYSTALQQEVKETVTNTWSKGGELSIGQPITYVLKPIIGGYGGSVTFSYANQWGESSSKARSIIIGSSTEREVVLKPGQAVIATLGATRGTLRVQVDYSADLRGDVACHFAEAYKGFHFWRQYIEEAQDVGDLPKSIDSREIISINFYSEAKVVVTDKETSEVITTYDVPISDPIYY